MKVATVKFLSPFDNSTCIYGLPDQHLSQWRTSKDYEAIKMAKQYRSYECVYSESR